MKGIWAKNQHFLSNILPAPWPFWFFRHRRTLSSMSIPLYHTLLLVRHGFFGSSLNPPMLDVVYGLVIVCFLCNHKRLIPRSYYFANDNILSPWTANQCLVLKIQENAWNGVNAKSRKVTSCWPQRKMKKEPCIQVLQLVTEEEGAKWWPKIMWKDGCSLWRFVWNM